MNLDILISKRKWAIWYHFIFNKKCSNKKIENKTYIENRKLVSGFYCIDCNKCWEILI